jgi:hypothetical protein
MHLKSASLALVVVTSVAASACSGSPDAASGTVYTRTIVRYDAAGRPSVSAETVNPEQQGRASGALQNGTSGGAGGGNDVDPNCKGSDLWLFDQPNRSGNELCLFDVASTHVVLSEIPRICFRYLGGKEVCMTWDASVRSFYAGIGPGTFVDAQPYAQETFSPYQLANTVSPVVQAADSIAFN